MTRRNEYDRRLKPIKHFLGQFFIIVVSVLIALAVDKWNTKRNERLLTEQYLGALTSELEEDIALFDDNLEGLQEKEVASSHLLRLVRGDVDDIADPVVLGRLAAQVARILRGKHKPTFTPNMIDIIIITTERIDPPFSSAVFEDLKSTGNLRLIEDITLRQDIINYYADLATIRNEISQLNNIVNDLAPTWLAIADQFSKEEFFGEKSLDTKESINRLRGNPEVERYLIRTRKNVAEKKEILKEARESAEDILATIENSRA